MSPSDQFLFLTERIDKGQEQARDQFAEIQRQMQSDRHAMRNDMQAGFGKVQADIQSLRAELTGTDRRLIVVETERKSEAGASSKRATWIALAISLGWSVLATIAGWIFGWHGKR